MSKRNIDFTNPTAKDLYRHLRDLGRQRRAAVRTGDDEAAARYHREGARVWELSDELGINPFAGR